MIDKRFKMLEEMLNDIDIHGGGIEGARKVRIKSLLSQYADITNNKNIPLWKKPIILAKFLFDHRNNLEFQEEIKKLRELGKNSK